MRHAVAFIVFAVAGASFPAPPTQAHAQGRALFASMVRHLPDAAKEAA